MDDRGNIMMETKPLTEQLDLKVCGNLEEGELKYENKLDVDIINIKQDIVDEKILESADMLKSKDESLPIETTNGRENSTQILEKTGLLKEEIEIKVEKDEDSSEETETDEEEYHFKSSKISKTHYLKKQDVLNKSDEKSRKYRGKKHKCRERVYQCMKCTYQTSWKSALGYHALSHDNPDDMSGYKLIFCKYNTNYKDKLISHICKQHTLPTKLKCNICCYATECRNHFMNHLRLHETGKCDSENNMFVEYYFYKDFREAGLHKCNRCNYQTVILTSFNQHLENHELSEKEECSQSDHVTNKSSSFEEHTGNDNSGEKIDRTTRRPIRIGDLKRRLNEKLGKSPKQKL